MSCKNTNFPINIINKNNKGICSTDCDLKFLYNPSTCICTNKEFYLSFSYDVHKDPALLFNKEYYDVSEIRLYTPSIHLYESNYSDAEIIVIHKSNTNKHLILSVPIKINDNEESLLNDIVERASVFTSQIDDSANLNVIFNLNNFIPISPFFYYKAKVPFDCQHEYHVCVFGNKNNYISISKNNLQSLQSIIKNQNYYIKNNIEFKINKSFKISKNTEIKCFPLPAKEGFTNKTSFSDIIETNSIDLQNILIVTAICGVILILISK